MTFTNPDGTIFSESPCMSLTSQELPPHAGRVCLTDTSSSGPIIHDNSIVDFQPGTTRANCSSVPETFNVPLSWRNLSYRVKKLQILDQLSGTALPGRCLAIMGSSGAGKTTFLNVLCDRLASGGAVKLSGRRQLGDVAYERGFRKALGFVTQDDILSPMDTPYDALWFSLRTRRGTDRGETHERVMEMLHTLQMVQCKDTVVGIPDRHTGLSGGERKRCNIGVELICDPKVLLLDEPTSGLDSVTAVKLVQQLRELARVGRTIIYTIHQPTAEVLLLFDDLMLLTAGRCVYHGPMADSLGYFESIGFKCPERYTAGDYFMKLLQDEKTSKLLIERWEEHLKNCGGSLHTKSIRLSENPSESSTAEFLSSYIKKFSGSTLTQLTEVFVRRLNEQRRDKLYLLSLAAQELFFSIVVGLIYVKLGTDMTSVQDRQGLLFIVTTNRALSSCFMVLHSFHRVRPVFVREQYAGAYSPLIYLAGTTAAQFPLMLASCSLGSIIIYFLTGLYTSAGAFFNFLIVLVMIQEIGMGLGILFSACFESLTIATGMAPLVIMPLVTVGGVLASTNRLRPYWHEIEKPSFVRHGFILLMRNEFKHIHHISCDAQKYGELFCLNQPKNGKEVMLRYGFDGDPQSTTLIMWLSLFILWVLIRVFCVIALTVVSRRKS